MGINISIIRIYKHYIKYFNYFVYIFMIVPRSLIISYREHRMNYGDLKNSFETYFVTGIF